MVKELSDLTEEEIVFLRKLDKKLHYTSKSFSGAEIFGKSKKIKIDDYTFRKMTKLEIKRVLKISMKSDIIFYPISTSNGFAVGFDLSEVDLFESEWEMPVSSLLRFRESQLPEGYDYFKLSEFFLDPENIRIAGLANIEIDDKFEGFYDDDY